MTKNEKITFILINTIASLVGIALFYFKEFEMVQTQFGNSPNHLTGDLLHLHILTVFPLVVIFGYLLGKHIIPKLTEKSKTRKFSGLTILLLFILMSLSGYIIQITINDRSLISNIHIVLSAAWLIIPLWHIRSYKK